MRDAWQVHYGAGWTAEPGRELSASTVQRGAVLVVYTALQQLARETFSQTRHLLVDRRLSSLFDLSHHHAPHRMTAAKLPHV